MRFDGIPVNIVLTMDDTLPRDALHKSNSYDYSSVMGLSFLLKSNHIVLADTADFRYRIFL